MIRVFFEGESEGESENEDEQNLLQHQEGSLDSESPEEANSDVVGEGGASSGKERRKQEPYDKSLPAQHLYLGEMDEEGVASVQEEETTYTLPLLYIPESVLFPGQILPYSLQPMYSSHEIAFLRHAFAGHHPIAVCTDLRGFYRHWQPERPKQSDLSVVGTTADVIAWRDAEGQRRGMGGEDRVMFKLMGRQRFQVLRVRSKLNGTMDCQLRILPEVLMTPRPSSLTSCPPSLVAGHLSTLLCSHLPDTTLHCHQRALKSRKALWSPRSSMSVCSAPGWVLKMYDTDYLRERILEEQHMQTITSDDKDKHLPDDVVSLSYWLARRLPVNSQTKFDLLKMNCPTMRIMRGLKILNDATTLYCAKCQTVIALKEHIFSMSVDGPLAAYVNPGGVVHDTLTVLQATNLRKVGRGTTEDSWFPGYQWTIVYCKECRDHKGWLFEAVRKNLTPKCFYGLRRPSIELFKFLPERT